MVPLRKEFPVLVVDDEPMVLDVMAKMLEKLGYPVQLARGSQEAIVLLTGSAFRLVITDFNMPTLNGQQLADWVKQHHPRTKVVIMTGCHSAETANLIIGGSIDALFYKPIGIAELRDFMSEMDLADAQVAHSKSNVIRLKNLPASPLNQPFTRRHSKMGLRPGEDNGT